MFWKIYRKFWNILNKYWHIDRLKVPKFWKFYKIFFKFWEIWQIRNWHLENFFKIMRKVNENFAENLRKLLKNKYFKNYKILTNLLKNSR